MDKEKAVGQIPRIYPESILDPPQIKLTKAEAHRGSVGLQLDEDGQKKPKGEHKMGLVARWKSLSRGKRIAVSLAGIFLLVLLTCTAYLGIMGYMLRGSAKGLVASAHTLKAAVELQDIEEINASFVDFKGSFAEFDGRFAALKPVSYIPYLGVYYRDGIAGISAGRHAIAAADIVLETVEPYADIIGFGPKGGEEELPEEEATANDRIDFLINTLEDIIPRIGEIAEHAQVANQELASIDPSRYPEEFRGVAVREQLESLLNMAQEASRFVANSQPLVEAAPYILGIDDTRTYLLIFQNDKELRPTGGFLTAYSILEVTNGKIQPVSSNDIYNLDGRYTPVVPAPDPIIRYLKGPYLISKNYRLRDMNWSPDFRLSMEFFLEEAAKAGIGDVDGIIAVDTHVVVNVLDAIGAVDVPGFGLYSSETDPRCDCPQVVYELESYADIEGPIVWSENEPGVIVFAPANYLNRKDIVGPLMNTVLSETLGQPKEKMPVLFDAAWRSLTQKNVLLYMLEPDAQKGVEAFGLAGRVLDFDGDYLHVVDANLGGRKSNMYVTQEVAQEVEIAEDGSVTKKVEITYQNPQDFDGWLNSVLPNWTRVYLPLGSEIVSVSGFEDEGDVYEELGKTVVSGGFELRPKGIKRITLEYKLPFKLSRGQEYKILIQKQPGTDSFLHGISVGKQTEEFFLRTDRELKFRI